MAENGYIGRVTGAGVQSVKAPITPVKTKGTKTVQRGDDLRAKSGKTGK